MPNSPRLQKIKKNITSVLRRHSEVSAAYIFGSVLNGYRRKESDVDIAVLLPERMSKSRRFNLRLHLIAELSRAIKTDAVDVVVLNDVDSILLRDSVLREGVLIYEASEVDRVDFETRMMSLSFDFRPFLDFYNAAYVARGAR